MPTVIDSSEGVIKLQEVIRNSAKPVVLAFSGMTCSGKSYLTEQLTRTNNSSAVPLDAFFRDLYDPKLPRDARRRKIFDVPDSYHKDDFVNVVKRLVKGEDVLIPQYEVATNRQVKREAILVRAKKKIFAEGLFAISLLHKPVRKSVKVYLDTPIEICLKRRIQRDTTRYGLKEEDVVRFFEERILPYHEEHFLPQKDMADIIIETR